MDLDFVRDLKPRDLELVDSKHFLPQLKRRESDLIWKITVKKASGKKLRPWYIYILLENQSTPDKTILLLSFLYILSLYDTLWRQSHRGLLPNVLPVILYNGQKDWNLPSNLRGLIAKRLPESWIPSFECFVLVEKDVPKETLVRLHNLVAAVILLERQQELRNLGGARTMLSELAKKVNK